MSIPGDIGLKINGQNAEINTKGVRLSPLIMTQSWSWGSHIGARKN